MSSKDFKMGLIVIKKFNFSQSSMVSEKSFYAEDGHDQLWHTIFEFKFPHQAVNKWKKKE